MRALDKNCYQGKVKGSNGAVYNVMIDPEHPKRSTCDCSFADGRRVICKHMVALYLGIFPEKEQQMMDYIEEQNQLYEQECEQEMKEREDEIRKYVMGLTKKELREILIQRMISDLEHWKFWKRDKAKLIYSSGEPYPGYGTMSKNWKNLVRVPIRKG